MRRPDRVLDRLKAARLGAQPPVERDSRWRQRGQVLVIFAGSLVALMMLMALVVDIGWYWSNGLRMQRAADAAALAGAVYMPDNFNGTAPNGQTAALAAAKRNGYVPDADTTITSTKDANPRQINVTITDKVGTFFLKVVGITTLDASRSSKAEFVLPVPMGSPQNYYGVGTFVNLVTPAPTTNPFTNPAGYTVANPTVGAAPSAFSAGGAWTGPGNVYTQDTNNATATATNQAEVWKTFTFGTFQAGATLDGLVINFDAKVGSAGVCKLKAEASWDTGTTWGNLAPVTANPTTAFSWLSAGSATDLSVWGSNHTWAAGDFLSTQFALRLTYIKTSGCNTVTLDEITAVVYSHTVTTYPAAETVQAVNSPLGSPLATQGFWGADITLGGDRSNGDQFDPIASNPDYDGLGVDYNVVIAGPSGQLQLYDPTFCATGTSSGGGGYGTGDHWINGPHNGVTTVYTLWDQNGTPYDISDDTLKGSSGALFANEVQSDQTVAFGNPGIGTDCSANIYHDKWYQLASGLPAGIYRLNVSTNVAGNTNTNAENMWSAWVSSSSGKSQIYGQGKMVTYNNLLAGTQLFYLAQIDKVHAGKTMEIKLFDPGDVAGNAFMRILSPDGNTYSYVNFTYSADNGRSSTVPVSTIQTASAPNNSFYQGSLITIVIPLPATYGSVGLTPAGEPGAGWWKIEYTVAGGNDTTTWQVDISGNPVHLLVP
jgi:Flp pilus assembly protein TadG